MKSLIVLFVICLVSLTFAQTTPRPIWEECRAEEFFIAGTFYVSCKDDTGAPKNCTSGRRMDPCPMLCPTDGTVCNGNCLIPPTETAPAAWKPCPTGVTYCAPDRFVVGGALADCNTITDCTLPPSGCPLRYCKTEYGTPSCEASTAGVSCIGKNNDGVFFLASCPAPPPPSGCPKASDYVVVVDTKTTISCSGPCPSTTTSGTVINRDGSTCPTFCGGESGTECPATLAGTPCIGVSEFGEYIFKTCTPPVIDTNPCDKCPYFGCETPFADGSRKICDCYIDATTNDYVYPNCKPIITYTTCPEDESGVVTCVETATDGSTPTVCDQQSKVDPNTHWKCNCGFPGDATKPAADTCYSYTTATDCRSFCTENPTSTCIQRDIFINCDPTVPPKPAIDDCAPILSGITPVKVTRGDIVYSFFPQSCTLSTDVATECFYGDAYCSCNVWTVKEVLTDTVTPKPTWMCGRDRKRYCVPEIVAGGRCLTGSEPCLATDLENQCKCVSTGTKVFTSADGTTVDTTKDGIWQCGAPVDDPVCPTGGVISGSACFVEGEVYTDAATSASTVAYDSCRADSAVCTCINTGVTLVETTTTEIYPSCADLEAKGWSFTYPTVDVRGTCSLPTADPATTATDKPLYVDGTSVQAVCISKENLLCKCDAGVMYCDTAPAKQFIQRPTAGSWDCHTDTYTTVPTCAATDTAGSVCSSAPYQQCMGTDGVPCQCQKNIKGEAVWFCKRDDKVVVCAEDCCSNNEHATTSDSPDPKNGTKPASGAINTDLCDPIFDVDVSTAEVFDGFLYKLRISLKFTVAAGTTIPSGVISSIYDVLDFYGVTVVITKKPLENGDTQLVVVIYIPADVLDALLEDDTIESLIAHFSDEINTVATDNRVTFASDPETASYLVSEGSTQTTAGTQTNSAAVLAGVAAFAVVML